ncbi:Phasin (PHA-granule associated protein), partial [Paraburkholderia steynii]
MFFMLTQDQVTAIRKVNLDLLFGLSNQVVEGVEKLTDLNIRASRSTLVDTFDLAQKTWSV